MEKYNNPCFIIFILLLLELVCVCCGDNVKKSVDNMRVDNNDENGDNDDSKDVAMDIPSDIEQENKTVLSLCSARRVGHNMHAIQNAAVKQFPFMASLMSLSDEHLCSGTVISNGLILTTALCVKKQISHVLLNTIRAKKENKGEILISVIKAEHFPSFTGRHSLNDVGLVYTHKFNSSVAAKLKISNFTNGQNIVDMEVFGFGLNQEVDHAKDLQYVGLENRFSESTLNAYIDCVESKEPTCFMDVGGPAIYGNELVGVVTKGQNECTKEMTSTYAINKLMATILPAYNFKSWVDEKIRKNEEVEYVRIPVFPSKLVTVVKKVSRRHGAANQLKISMFTILACLFSPFFN